MLEINKKRNYETEGEDWAFSDGVTAGVKAMCLKFNISEKEVYKKLEVKDEI
jgi:hypothetical protein